MESVVNVTEAKAHLSEILRRVREGESILVLSRGRPVARISPVTPSAEGGDSRLARLEALGLVRRGAGLDVRKLADPAEEMLPEEDSLLDALRRDREEDR
jgi:prevent-host-death family protein